MVTEVLIDDMLDYFGSLQGGNGEPGILGLQGFKGPPVSLQFIYYIFFSPKYELTCDVG